MSKSRITIKDIARELRISPSTVSRALANKWDVNPETRKAVLELAEKMNYQPNPISLSLKTQQSMFVGVIIPEFITSFFPEVIIGMESVLGPKGYQVLISQSNESSDTELSNIKALENKMVAGFIVSLSVETQNVDYFNRFVNSEFPIVFFNRTAPELRAPSVLIDDYKWAFRAVEHLLERGCRRIVHLSGPENLQISLHRRQGYEDALHKYGITVDKSLIIPCGVMMESGVTAAYRILDMTERPDAIFAFNDPTAIGAMKTLQKHEIRIPEDVAVVGFTESKMAVIVEPNLTSVEQPTFEMGRAAAELLLEQINNPHDEKHAPKTIILDATLNIRKSSLRPNTPTDKK